MLERGPCDALAQLVLTWMLMIRIQRKIAVYCSDLSGAFYKFNSKIFLIVRTQRASYIGSQSFRNMKIGNMLYYGTVVSQPL